MSMIMMVIFVVFVVTNMPRTVLGLYEVTTISSILECYDRACRYNVSSLRSVNIERKLLHDFDKPLYFLSDGWWTVGCATYSCWILQSTSPSTVLLEQTSERHWSASFIENWKYCVTWITTSGQLFSENLMTHISIYPKFVITLIKQCRGRSCIK